MQDERGLSQTQPREFEPLLFLSILISDGNQRHGLIAADKKENMEQRFSQRSSSIIAGARTLSYQNVRTKAMSKQLLPFV